MNRAALSATRQAARTMCSGPAASSLYADFLPAPLAAKLAESAAPVSGVEGLRVTPSLLRDFGDSVGR